MTYNPSMQAALSRWMVLGAAILFSTGGAAVKSCGLTDWQVAGFRCGVAGIVLWIALPVARRGFHRRIFSVGVCYAVTLVCFSLANKATTSANAIFLQSAAPLYILLLAPWLLRERIRRHDILLMAVMAAGLGLLLTGEDTASATAPHPWVGNLYGAVAGIAWALTVIGLRSLATTDGSDALRAVLAGNLVAFVATLPAALPLQLSASSPADWGWLLYLGVFQVAGAYLLLTRGIEQVPAFEASLLLLVEPVLNPLWTWWLHGEIPSRGALFGGLLILTAATLKTRLDPPPPVETC